MVKLLSDVKIATLKFTIAVAEEIREDGARYKYIVPFSDKLFHPRIHALRFQLSAVSANLQVSSLFPVSLAYICMLFGPEVTSYSYYVVSAVIKGQPTRAE